MNLPSSFPDCNYAALSQTQSPFRKTPISENKAFRKMEKTAEKAIDQHARLIPMYCPNPYATKEDLSFDFGVKHKKPLQLSISSYEDQGPKPYMEDVSFHKPLSNGMFITGILDGHGGSGVPQFASSLFQRHFEPILKESKGHVHLALEVTIGKIQRLILLNKDLDHEGSPAVFCVFDPKQHRVTTATIGDCEANCYREKAGKMISIPMSYIKDWTDPHEKDRMLRVYGSNKYCYTRLSNGRALGWDGSAPSDHHYLAVKKNNLATPTALFIQGGCNVSCAFGDANHEGCILPIPSISIHGMKDKDCFTLSSDGVKNVSEQELVQRIQAVGSKKIKPKQLVDYARQKGVQDNMSVIIVRAEK